MRCVPPSQVPTTRYPVDRFFGTIFNGGCWTPASAKCLSIDFRTSAHVDGAPRASQAAQPNRRAAANAVGGTRRLPLETFARARRRTVFIVRAVTGSYARSQAGFIVQAREQTLIPTSGRRAFAGKPLAVPSVRTRVIDPARAQYGQKPTSLNVW